MNQTNLAVLPAAEIQTVDALTVHQIMMDDRTFERMVKYADMMASGTVTTPKHLQGKPGDCFAVVTQSMLWGFHPHAVAQKTHLVNGNLGYEAQLVVAVLQSSGSIVGSPNYEYRSDGEALECRVGCILRGQRDVTWGEWLVLKSVTTRNSPLWKTNPKQQFGYLQAKNWARAYCPGAILGVNTPDELEALPPRDMGNAEVVTEAPTSNTRTNALKEHLGAGKKKQQPAITVEQVIDGINAANTPEELLAAAEQAKNLNADDKAKAGSAYTARLHQLKAAANTIDQGTGEIYEPGEVPAIDPDDEFLKGLEQGQAQ